jgi:hypothetical protein
MGRFHYTARNGARTQIAELIKRNYLDLAHGVGLTEADLDAIIDHGETAREADRQQQVQLATIQGQRADRKFTAADIFRREEEMRDRTPLVIGSLAETDPAQARWLSALSFARYRIRELPVSPEELANDPAVKRVERVEREDIPTRLAALANFCKSILEPGREPIVAAFEARALTRADIETLGADADALARLGRNLPAAAEATAREAEAVKAQNEMWSRARKAIRKVVHLAGTTELKAKLADC